MSDSDRDKDKLELLESLKDLKQDNEPYFQIDWIMKKIMKISDRDIEMNKAFKKAELRMKKMKRIIDED